MPRQRLDQLLVERGLASSRSQASVLIRLGRVRVAAQIMDKPGMLLSIDTPIDVIPAPAHVSRGGLKLEAALDRFAVDPRGAVCLDVGASTGGFTEVLLQRGARRVYAVDVGRGQLDWSLRQDARVVNMERTDIRAVASLPEAVDVAVVDVAFISVRLVLPAVGRLLAPHGIAIVLVKPQFEAGRKLVPRGGVIRQAALHHQVLQSVLEWIAQEGWRIADAAPSPIAGGRGNREFFVLVARSLAGATLPPGEALRRALQESPAASSSP